MMNNREKRRRARGLLRWVTFTVANLVRRGKGLVTTKQAANAVRSRAYPHGQWHRWYKANRRFQNLTGGASLYRWQVR